MTPERALEHDERCEHAPRYGYDAEFWCHCAERALAVARQREEEAERELSIAARHAVIQAEEITRLTLAASEAQSQAESWRLGLGQANDKLLELQTAASESARTLQVRLEHLQNELEHSDAFRVDLLEACKKQRIRAQNAEAQVTALREAMRQGTAAIHADHDQALIPCPIVICQFFRAALPQDGA